MSSVLPSLGSLLHAVFIREFCRLPKIQTTAPAGTGSPPTASQNKLKICPYALPPAAGNRCNPTNTSFSERAFAPLANPGAPGPTIPFRKGERAFRWKGGLPGGFSGRLAPTNSQSCRQPSLGLSRIVPVAVAPRIGIGLRVSREVVGDSLWVSSGENQPWPTHPEPIPLVSFRLLAASHSSDSTSM